MITKILIPADGSPNSLTAQKYGIYIARKLEATITALYVIDINLIQGPILNDVSGAVVMPPYEGFFDTIEKSIEEKADAVLKEFEDNCKQSGVKVEVKKEIGGTGRAIIERFLRDFVPEYQALMKKDAAAVRNPPPAA